MVNACFPVHARAWWRVLVAALAVLAACSAEPATRTAPPHDGAGRRDDISRSAAAPAAAAPAAAAPAAARENPALPAADPADPCAALEPVPTRVPAPRRLVAIGDVHGDLEATRAALRLAGAMDQRNRWVGGDLVIVQTGDILDRGDDERAILELFERLRGQAEAAGGAVYTLLGNHELMNAYGDLRYVTPGGMADFRDVRGLDLDAPELAAVPEPIRARAAAFFPGGPYARRLSRNNVIMVIGDTVFVHGGVLPAHARYGIERINREIRCWLLGPERTAAPPASAIDADSPVWSRHYSLDPPECQTLERALDALGAKRMIVGHTVQERGITSACDGKVWRIDVGMAAHYGGRREVLELRGGRARVLGR